MYNYNIYNNFKHHRIRSIDRIDIVAFIYFPVGK